MDVELSGGRDARMDALAIIRGLQSCRFDGLQVEILDALGAIFEKGEGSLRGYGLTQHAKYAAVALREEFFESMATSEEERKRYRKAFFSMQEVWMRANVGKEYFTLRAVDNPVFMEDKGVWFLASTQVVGALSYCRKNFSAHGVADILRFGSGYSIYMAEYLQSVKFGTTTLELSQLRALFKVAKGYGGGSGKWNFRKKVLDMVVRDLSIYNSAGMSVAYSNPRGSDAFTFEASFPKREPAGEV